MSCCHHSGICLSYSVHACVCREGSGSNPVDLYCWFEWTKYLKIRSHLMLNENFRLIDI